MTTRLDLAHYHVRWSRLSQTDCVFSAASEANKGRTLVLLPDYTNYEQNVYGIQPVKLVAYCALGFLAAFGATTAVGQAAENICTTTSRPDCREAVVFFERFQKAVTSDKRDAVASMIRYPLRVRLKGHNVLIKNKSQLLRDYDDVFTGVVRCAIAKASTAEVWGNWQGYTVADGVAWWEASTAPASPFKIITVNNGSFQRGCSSRE